MSNITEVVGKELNMTTMNRGIFASGLNELLNGAGPFTLFVPSDQAFAKLQRGAMEELLLPENKNKLADLLKHHIVAGKLDFKDLKDGDVLKSLDGKELHVKTNWGKTSIDGATIQNRDVLSSNGTIHSLDNIIQN